MNILSLFDGISCGRIALERAGVPVTNYFASEIDKFAIKIAQSNYPDTIQLGDIRDIKKDNLPTIDLLIGGSPCQGFSIAGTKLNFEHEQSKLFFEYVRLLKELNPKYFLLENVNMKKEWQDIISGYLGVEPIKINSLLVSASRRNRLYWTSIPNIQQPLDLNKTFDDIIDTNENNWISEDRIIKISKWKSQQQPLKNTTLIGSTSKLPCLTARGYNQSHSGMVLITDGKKYRYLSNLEAERAMTLPENYTSIGTDRERSHSIGNGWTVDVIAHIFKNILG